MSDIPTGTRVAFLICLCSLAGTASASILWFDETGGGGGYSSFGTMAEAYADFMPKADAILTFDDLATGTNLGSQYMELGVGFLNTVGEKHGSSNGVRAEGGGIAEALTGYDGSYMPNGDAVYIKFDNDDTCSPFTMTFDKPVNSIGAFLAMGVEGQTHSVQVTLYGQDDHVLGTRTYESWLWESKSSRQNYETFFGVQLDTDSISRVSILNLSHTNYSNALGLDNVQWSRGSEGSVAIPEPTVSAMLAGCAVLFFGRRRGVGI